MNANADQQQGGDALQIVKTMKRGERGSINVSIKILPDMNGVALHRPDERKHHKRVAAEHHARLPNL